MLVLQELKEKGKKEEKLGGGGGGGGSIKICCCWRFPIVNDVGVAAAEIFLFLKRRRVLKKKLQLRLNWQPSDHLSWLLTMQLRR